MFFYRVFADLLFEKLLSKHTHDEIYCSLDYTIHFSKLEDMSLPSEVQETTHEGNHDSWRMMIFSRHTSYRNIKNIFSLLILGACGQIGYFQHHSRSFEPRSKGYNPFSHTSNS